MWLKLRNRLKIYLNKLNGIVPMSLGLVSIVEFLILGGNSFTKHSRKNIV